MTTQPPTKRRKISNHNAQAIHINDEITTSTPHQTHPQSTNNHNRNNTNHTHHNSFHHSQCPPFPVQGTEPKTITESKNNINKFHRFWKDLVDNYIPEISTNDNTHCDIDSAPRSESISISSSPNGSIHSQLQEQITELKQQNNALRCEVQETKKTSRKYMNLYNAEIKEKDSYKLRLKSLAQMMKTGQRPHFEAVSMNKINPICTQRIFNVKRDIKSYHISKSKKKKKKHDICVEIKQYQNHKWITKKSLTHIIKQYIISNIKNNTPSKPDIMINKSRIPYNFVLQTFRIKKDSHRIKALGTGYQRGLKVLLDVPSGTVIGNYIGIEYMMEEFQTIFSHSNEEAVRNSYAFDLMLKVPIINDKGKLIEYKEEEIVIDGYGLREKLYQYQRNGNNKNKECPYSAHLLYINDCRNDISMEHPDKDDIKYWNIDFVEAVVNGYPAVYLITRCDVKKGTELMSYYGDSYDVALKQQTEYQRMQNCIVTLLDNSILRGVDLSGDVWTLE